MKTRAIVLKKQNTNEYDQLVTCYTEESGKITAIAKSILKKNSIQAMHLDLFNLVEFDLISGNHFPIVTGAQAEKTYSRMKTSLGSVSVAYTLADYIDKLVLEYSKDNDMWNLLTDVLENLDSGTQPIDILRTAQLKLLDILGYYPSLDAPAVQSSIDKVFEHVGGRKFHSLNFVYSVLKLI